MVEVTLFILFIYLGFHPDLVPSVRTAGSSQEERSGKVILVKRRLRGRINIHSSVLSRDSFSIAFLHSHPELYLQSKHTLLQHTLKHLHLDVLTRQEQPDFDRQPSILDTNLLQIPIRCTTARRRALELQELVAFQPDLIALHVLTCGSWKGSIIEMSKFWWRLDFFFLLFGSQL